MRTILIFLFSTMCSLALSSAGVSRFYKFHLGNQDGLGSNYIKNIGQDKHGYVWVVTNSGLSRFEGSGFQTFNAENSGLGTADLNCIVADPVDPDKVWIGSKHDGLYIYDYKDGMIFPFEGSIETLEITSLSVSHDNKIWVVHYENLPEKLDPETGDTKPLFGKKPTGFPLSILCTSENQTGDKLYIGHENEGFTTVDIATHKFKNYKYQPGNNNTICGNTVYSIYEDVQGLIWIGTENGVSVYEPDSDKFWSYTHNDSPNSILPGAVRSIRRIKNGNLWIATAQGGISIVSGDQKIDENIKFVNHTPYFYGNPGQKLYSSSLNTIFEDSFGNKWIGYQSDGIDVACYDSPIICQVAIFGQYDTTPPHPAVWSMTTDKKGDIWIAGEREIARLSDKLPERYHLPQGTIDQNTPARGLYADSRNNLWIGTLNAGAYMFDMSSHSMRKVNSIDKEVRCFIEDRNGDILAGTRNGIYRITGDLEARPDKRLNEIILGKNVTCLYKDKLGKMYIGSFAEGLTISDLNRNETKILNVNHGLPSNTINDVCEDSKGRIWIATRRGVVSLSPDNGGEIKRHAIAQGGGSINIKSIEEDKNGRIWMSSENGISCYDPKTGKTDTYTHFHRSSLKSFLEGSSCIKPDGTVFFGSLNGLAFFNPGNISSTKFNKGEVTINSLKAYDSREEDMSKGITIPVNSDNIKVSHNHNTLKLQFHYQDFTKVVNTELRYNMEGVNDLWSPISGANEVTFRNLKPGTYKFRIIYRSFGGKWSNPETLLTIKINPPFYSTWWAILIYIAVAVAILWVMLGFPGSHPVRRRDIVMNKNSVRHGYRQKKAAYGIHPEIGNELHTPLTLIIEPLQDLIDDPEIHDKHRSKLQEIKADSIRVLSLSHRVIDFKEPMISENDKGTQTE